MATITERLKQHPEWERLTQPQRAFLLHLALGRTAVEAIKAAYNPGSEKAISAQKAKLNQHPVIITLTKWLQEELATDKKRIEEAKVLAEYLKPREWPAGQHPGQIIDLTETEKQELAAQRALDDLKYRAYHYGETMPVGEHWQAYPEPRPGDRSEKAMLTREYNRRFREWMNSDGQPQAGLGFDIL
jgi:hypothetical protein